MAAGFKWSWREESNPRPADYKTGFNTYVFDYIELVSARYTQAKFSGINRMAYSSAGDQYLAVYRECTGDSPIQSRGEQAAINCDRTSQDNTTPSSYTVDTLRHSFARAMILPGMERHLRSPKPKQVLRHPRVSQYLHAHHADNAHIRPSPKFKHWPA